MKTCRLASAVLAGSVLACNHAEALLTINVTSDTSLVPGYVVNTFTVDSDTDMTIAAALTDLNSGSILQVPGFFGPIKSNGPGDSYVSMNNSPNSLAFLGAADLGGETGPTFNESLIDVTWYSTDTGDIGTGMHLATFTFSADAQGLLSLGVLTATEHEYSLYSILDGMTILDQVSSHPFVIGTGRPIPSPPPPPPPPAPTPDPNPGTGINPPPDPGGDAIPEPTWLGIVAAGTALLGVMHRRRLHTTTPRTNC